MEGNLPIIQYRPVKHEEHDDNGSPKIATQSVYVWRRVKTKYTVQWFRQYRLIVALRAIIDKRP